MKGYTLLILSICLLFDSSIGLDATQTFEERLSSLESTDVNFADDDDEKITYWYYSQKNEETGIQVRNNSDSLNGTSYDSNLPTMLLVHGFLESMNFPNIVDFRQNWVKNYDQNVFVVNYINYSPSDGDIYDFYQNIGNNVCDFVLYLINEQGLKAENLHIVAHSVGCHVAGEAGKCLRRNKHPVSRLTGLDPANWNNLPPETTMDVLRPGDADIVDCIHTSTTFGINKPICRCNFYPAGGSKQPGCDDAIGLCDHLSSFRYYIRTMTEPEAYSGYKCSRFDGSTPVDCDTSKRAYLGAIADTNCDLGTVWYVESDGVP